MEGFLSILMAIGVIALFVAVIIFIIWVFKCAAQKNSIMELYEGYFTISGAYVYLTFSVMRIVVPVLAVVGAISSCVTSENGVQVGGILICLLAGAAIGALLHLGKVKLDKRLVGKYGPVAAKEISKVMIKAGFGAACSMALFLIKETTFQLANPHFIETTDGGMAYVIYCGDGTYVDRHGNTYTEVQVH